MCNDCNKTEKQDKTASDIGKQVGETLYEGTALVGRGAVWLARMLAVGTASAGKAVADEYKRQSEEGFIPKKND